MLDIYCDESYDDHVYALAGWAAVDTGWSYFNLAWREMLAGFVMPDGSAMREFHAAPICNRDIHSDSPFRGWTFDDEKAAFTAAVNVIADDKRGAGVLWRIGCAAAIPADADWLADRNVVWQMLFTRLFLGLVLRYGPQNGLTFTFDRKKDIHKAAQGFYCDAKKLVDEYMPGKLAADVVRFETAADFPQLQAADLWAYEWRRRISNKITKPERRPRTSYTRLCESRGTNGGLFCYDQAAIDAIRTRVKARETTFIQALVDHPATEE